MMVVVVVRSNGNEVLGTGVVDGIGVVGDGVVDEDEVDRN